MRLKEFMVRSLNEGHAAKFTDAEMPKLNVSDLVDIFRDTGYTVSNREEQYYISAFYKGKNKNGVFVYYFVIEENGDSGKEGTYYVSDFFVTRGKDGSLTGDFGGMPLEDNFHDEESAEDYARSARVSGVTK